MMGKKSSDHEMRERLQIIQSVKTPLAFFVLSVLVVEGLLATLLVSAEGTDKTIAIVGMLILLLGAGAAVFFLAYRKPTTLTGSSAEQRVPDALEFDRVISEMSSTIARLERDELRLAKHYLDQGDLSRLLDGLYSGLLYASSAVPTGKIEPIFYGNLMEWDKTKAALRVRYFKGPYNDEIITRTFPMEGPKQGVASAAVKTGEIQIRNLMEAELKERGEARLRAMMSIPVTPENSDGPEPGAIVAVNIDSVVENVFPHSGSADLGPVRKRAHELAEHVRRVNRLRRKLVQTVRDVGYSFGGGGEGSG